MTAVSALWQAALVLGGGTLLALVYKGFDRKLAARMQGRIGPPIRQPFLDLGKLLVKETVVPRTAVRWVFNLMPFLALVAAGTVLLYLPVGPFAPVLSGYGDVIVVLYLLALPAIAMALGGFASGSPYGVVGAQRELVMLMSYEFPLAVVVVALAWRVAELGAGPAFSLATLAGNPLWAQVGPLGVLGLALLLVALLVVTPAELSKIPFDIPEAETEIAGGLVVEYSGVNLALFYLADAIKTVAMAALVVALFIPYGIAGPLGIGGIGGQILDVAFFFLKVFAVIFAAVTTVRVAFARLKVDQIARGFWIPLTAVALAGLLLLVLDKAVVG
ncbi:TPA: NADH-quinone oxidoreductase subunit H [Candidatus Bipolaricaulota bacterium]|nr:NADH-quinone oxidoreductase subunit H [Candidatus Bipolaricaulota bacterium]